MAAYNAGGSLVWSAALNATQFNSGIQSMVAQMAYAQRASQGLSASLSSIATITFAAVVGGIASITAAIYVATKAAADWETQMMSIARVSIDNFDYSTPQGKEQFRQLSRANQEIYMNVPLKNGTESLIKAQEPFALAGFTGKALTDLTENLLKFSTDINYAVSEENIANAIVKSAQINRGEVEALGGGDYQKGVVEYSKKYLDTVLALSNKYTISPADLIKASTDAAGSAASRGTLNQTSDQLAMYTLLNQFGVRPDIMRTMLSSSVSTAGLGGQSTARITEALNAMGMATEQIVTSSTGKSKTEKIDYNRAQVAGYLLGVSEDRFRKMMDEDADTTTLQLVDAIMKQKFNGTEDENILYKSNLISGLTGGYAGREMLKTGAGGAVELLDKMRTEADQAWSVGGQVQSQYENSLLELNKQWDLMGQRAYTIRELLGEIVIDPVKSGVKHFSEGLKGAAQWLTKIVDGSRNIDGTVNTWEAIGKVIDGIKSKIPKDAFKIAVSLVGAALVISNLNTIKTAASMAVGALLKMAGITLSPLLGPITTLVGALGTIGIAAAAVAVGLGAIGYSLNPEKFTYFNQLATEAINGVSIVVKQLYTDLSTGDWSAAATHLKDAFMATIAWLQGIDWGRLGSEIVTMIGDGAKAVISTALNLAGWIYDNLRNWVNGGGPYKLGQDIADFIGNGLKSASKIDVWETLKSAFGTISDWIGLGYDIIANIGSGVMSKVGEAFNPAANKIVEVLAKAAYDIWIVFGKTWNTLIYTATIAATGIGNAFSGIGEKIAGFLKPAIDAVSNLASAVSNINLPNLGDIGNTIGNIANPVIEYYNPDSGARISIEEYNRRAKGESGSRTTKGFEAVRMYGGKSENIKSPGRNLLPSNNFEIFDTARSSTEKYANVDYTKLQQYALAAGITTSTSEQLHQNTELAWMAGYRTGGKGFVMDELVAANDKETYLMTDRGDYMTWIKDAKMSTDALKDTLQYYIDFPADSSAMAKEYANMMVPLKETSTNIKTSSEEASRITTSGATTSVNILKDGIFESTVGFKDASDYSTKKTMSISDFINSTSRNTAVETGAITKRAVEESYGPVRIGLTDSGQKIAVIGKVVQQQFEQSGNKLVNDTTGAGSTFKGDATSGGQNVKNDLSTGGDILLSKLASAQIGGSGGSSGGVSGYTDVILDKLGGTVASVLGGSLKGLFGNGGTTTTSEAGLLRNVEDITCTGDRVMINTGIYTSPTGEKTAFNPMNNEETRLLSNKVEGTFQDMTCIGTTVNIPGLKYTNPYGVTSYINPMDYNSGGGVLDYQQQGSTQVSAAKSAGTITVNSAKTSSEYQKGATNSYAQAIDSAAQRTVTVAEYNAAITRSSAIEAGNYYKNTSEFVTDDMKSSYFEFSDVIENGTNQAYDMFSRQLTTSDIEYAKDMETIALFKEQNANMKEVNGQLLSASNTLASAGQNLKSSFGSMIESMAASLGMRGGGWGGTSIGGGGQYVGMGSTNPYASYADGFRDWGGTAASIALQGGSYSGIGSIASSAIGGRFDWAAKGSLIEEPSRVIAGEKGRELILPNNLTELFLKLAAMGFNSTGTNGGETVIIVNIDGEQVERVVTKRQKSNLNRRGLKLH